MDALSEAITIPKGCQQICSTLNLKTHCPTLSAKMCIGSQRHPTALGQQWKCSKSRTQAENCPITKDSIYNQTPLLQYRVKIKYTYSIGTAY